MVESGLLPATQFAVQLVGPGELRLNRAKEVRTPGPHQILVRVEAVGLCFSDLKLLKQFSNHARKGQIVEGISRAVLSKIPSYVPGEQPTVPGHEVVCRIVAVGDKVIRHRIGERCLVQTDYRMLRTESSNASFGYNFEGGLQEYVLMDERVVIDPETGERFLIPVANELSASAVALAEPWACVENSYANPERQHVKGCGRLLVIVDQGLEIEGLTGCIAAQKPAFVTVVGGCAGNAALVRRTAGTFTRVDDLASLPGNFFDDIVYFGAARRTIETLDEKLAPGGIANIVTAGRTIGEPVSIGIGRIHYGMTRWIGTVGRCAEESYRTIPLNGEIRPRDRIAVIGAAGPMGQMHVIRNICQAVPGISITGTDVDDGRLEALRHKAQALAQAAQVELWLVNTLTEPLAGTYSYVVLLVPVAKLVAESIRNSMEGTIVNIFAGIQAATKQELDLDTYIKNKCYMTGTSGSVIRDMKTVLKRIEGGQLDTNSSVAAISGMAGVEDGLSAVGNRILAGKIVVYPQLHDLGLVPLSELGRCYPSVRDRLRRGLWTAAAEQELLRLATGP